MDLKIDRWNFQKFFEHTPPSLEKILGRPLIVSTGTEQASDISNKRKKNKKGEKQLQTSGKTILIVKTSTQKEGQRSDLCRSLKKCCVVRNNCECPNNTDVLWVCQQRGLGFHIKIGNRYQVKIIPQNAGRSN